MKALNVDHFKDSYLEGIHVTQDETTNVSLKQALLVPQTPSATQLQTLQSLALHRKALEERLSNFERNTIQQPEYETPDTTQFGYASPIQS